MAGRKTKPLKKDQRRDTRVAFEKDLEEISLLPLGGGPNQRISAGRIVNMSNSGLGLRIRQDPPDNSDPLIEEGTMLRLRVPIKDTTITMPILGQVLWLKKETRQKRIRAGIRFVL